MHVDQTASADDQIAPLSGVFTVANQTTGIWLKLVR
jgi:hypothetical protein